MTQQSPKPSLKDLLEAEDPYRLLTHYGWEKMRWNQRIEDGSNEEWQHPKLPGHMIELPPEDGAEFNDSMSENGSGTWTHWEPVGLDPTWDERHGWTIGKRVAIEGGGTFASLAKNLEVWQPITGTE